MASLIKSNKSRLGFSIGIIFTLLLSACGGNSPTSINSLIVEEGSPQEISNPSQSQKTISQVVDGQVVNRSYTIRKPQNTSKESYPVVFFFHGADDNGQDWLQRNPQVSALIDNEAFIGIFPDAHQGNWNLDDATGADDIEFVSLIVNDLDTLTLYSDGPLHAVGIQQGANLINHLAKKTEFFSAIAPIMSQQTVSTTEIVPTRPVSVFQVNTAGDSLVPIDGGIDVNGNQFVSAQQSAENWASSFNCDMQASDSSTRWSGYETYAYTYSNCLSSQRVRYHVVEQANDSLSFADEIDLYKLIWIFFSYNQDQTPENFKILSLGDSYTIGLGVCEGCSFPEQLSTRVEDELPSQDSVDLQIIAQTGWTTSNLKEAIEAEAPSNDFDLVTLLIGVNNQVQSKPSSLYESEFIELVDTAIALAEGNQGKVIVLSIPDYGFTPFGQLFDPVEITSELDAYNQFAEDYCRDIGISYIYITDITRQGLDNPDLVAGDNLHPSQLAYTKFVDRLMPIALDKLF